MKYAQLADIKQLIATPEDSEAISIFIPTHRISLNQNIKADKIRLKNAISDIESHLENKGTNKDNMKKYTSKLHELYSKLDFWKYRDNGIAIYAKKNKVVFYDLPIEIEPAAYVGSNFIISPLLAGMKDSYKYYLLDLNLEQPRFFVASQSRFDSVIVDSLPGDMKTSLRIDEYQQQHQHATSPGGLRDAHHHGHGGKNDQQDKDINKYLRKLDSVLHTKILHKSNLPLIIAGDTSTVEKFRQITKYRNVLDDSIEGNHQNTPEQDLHELSWSLMAKHIEVQEKLFSSIFDKAKYRDDKQTLINGEKIRKAAAQGRIATLFINIVNRTYDSVVRKMEQRYKIALPSDMRQLKNLEDAAQDVIQYGGEVHSFLYNNNETNDRYIKAILR